MKEFYGAKDVQNIVGCGSSKAYEIIRSLIEKFKKEYPTAITIQSRIPIWYFNEKVLGTKKEN